MTGAPKPVTLFRLDPLSVKSKLHGVQLQTQIHPKNKAGRRPGVPDRGTSPTRCGREIRIPADTDRGRKKPRAEETAPTPTTVNRPEGFAGMIVDEVRRKGVSADYTFAAGVMLSLFSSNSSTNYSPLHTILARFRKREMSPEAMIEAAFDVIRAPHSVAKTLRNGLECCARWREADKRWPDAILDFKEMEDTNGKVDVDDAILLVLDSN